MGGGGGVRGGYFPKRGYFSGKPYCISDQNVPTVSILDETLFLLIRGVP